jgi:membrane fusion protein
VLKARADPLQGEMAIFVPFAWRLVGYVLFFAVTVALAFLSLATYSRVETVSGLVVPDRGVAAVVPPRAGIVTAIAVDEGERVAAGAALATVHAEEFLPDGGSAAEALESAIGRQDRSLEAQSRSALLAAQAQQRRNSEQRAGLAEEIAQIEDQIALQLRLTTSAEEDLQRVRDIAVRGFISARDVRMREDNFVMRQQQLSQLRQTLASRVAALAEAERETARLMAEADEGAASFAASRAQVAQQAIGVRGSRAYVLRAPVGGWVTGLSARPGQPASPQRPLLNIVPEGAVLRAELAVPSSAVGFLEPGQEVRLAIDAFPYQQYGTVTGRVRSVAASASDWTGADGEVHRIYPVIVELERDEISAAAGDRPLRPGMTLTARIVTERRTFLEWLFQPLFAVRHR